MRHLYEWYNTPQECSRRQLKMKKIIAGAAGLLLAIAVMGSIREIIWRQYIPPAVIGDTVNLADAEETDTLEGISRKWFDEYAKKLKGWKVPYNYRLTDARIDRISYPKSEMPGTSEQTDAAQAEKEEQTEGYVQIDYTVRTASSNYEIISNLRLVSGSYRRTYKGQMVLGRKKTGENRWQIMENMSPVQFQIKYTDIISESSVPQTEHFTMKTGVERTCYVRDHVLYVTYDAGEHFVEVPDGYEKVCKTANGTYQEYLTENSYLISPEFTAFAAYEGEGVSLLYSTDAGQSRKESRISELGFRANTFLSGDARYCCVTFAADRSLGHDYYVTFCSKDLENWKPVELPETLCSNLDCVFWSDEQTGYYAKGRMVCRTTDGGKTFHDITIPETEEVKKELGYDPFDTVERIYQENGMLYMIVGQGDDGDYVKDGKLRKALYRSQDGSGFTFVEEVADDTPDLAG